MFCADFIGGDLIEKLNFLFAVRTYIHEWVEFDRHARTVLGTRSVVASDEDVLIQLKRVAVHYRVIRTLKIEGGGLKRLGPVWSALEGLTRPNSYEDAKSCVNTLVGTLEQHYGQRLPSAASKFLWMRFGSPIVVYDSLTLDWMREYGGCPRNENSYDDFYDAWRRNFRSHRAAIDQACERLIRARAFFRPNYITRVDFDKAVRSRWFEERVFDHALIRAAGPKI